MPRGFPAPGSLAVGVAASLLLYVKMLPDPAGRTLGSGTGDPAQAMWFLANFPSAVLHGRNPLVTDFIQYPSGVNLMWNANAPLLDAVASPVTLPFGPVVALNALLVLGPALTTWTARIWLGRHIANPIAALLGGLLVGFSGYVVGHGSQHVSLAFAAVLPVILMLIEDLLWRRPRPMWRTGVLLGVAVTAQALIVEEPVLIIAFGLLTAIVGGLVTRPRVTLRAVGGAWRGASMAVGTFAVLFGYPLWVQFHGGSQLRTLRIAPYVAEPQDWVLPNGQQLIGGPSRVDEWATRATGAWEAGGYIGIPLLIALIVIAVALRRRWAVQIASVAAVLTMLASLGPRLRIGDNRVGPSLLWAWVCKLPTMQDVLPIRLALATSLAVGFLVAVGLDAAAVHLAGRRRAVAIGGLAVSLAFVVPATEPAGTATNVPAFFSSRAVRHIPYGAPALVLPLAAPPTNEMSMLWSATSGARYRDVGGAAKRPSDSRESTSSPIGTPLVQWATVVVRGPVLPSAAARAQLRATGIRYVIVATAYVSAGTVQRVQALVGRPPSWSSGGVVLWQLSR